MFGIMVFYKPIGWTSYDVVRKVKRWFGEEKIGHGGTLDPLAEGILILGIGTQGTKQLSVILNHTLKTYIACIEFGAVSTTDDREGEIVKTSVGAIHELPLQREKIENCLQTFTGEILQTPPVYSAVKIKGVAAYKRVRRGEHITLEPKKVLVKQLTLMGYNYPEMKVEITCGSGFYVRSLARDVGKSLGVGAYLKELRRTRIWNPENSEIDFKIEDCITIADIEKNFIEMHMKIIGKVQGVGFRIFVQQIAQKHDLCGLVRNCTDGSVEIISQGSVLVLGNFLNQLKNSPSLSRVEDVKVFFKTPRVKYIKFSIF